MRLFMICFLITYIRVTFVYKFLAYGMSDVTEYYVQRAKLVKEEDFLAFGGNTTLDPSETRVNHCLMQYKLEELDYAFDHPQYFNFSHHYFTYKNKMRNSKVYRIIKNMPKGAALHIHDLALLGPDYIMNITYMNDLHVCFDPLRFLFANQPPSLCKWQRMETARRNAENLTKFDEDIRKLFTLVVDDPQTVYPSTTEVWKSLTNYFTTIRSLVTYRPVFEQYIYDALKKFREDKVMYIEVRSALPNLYELDGTAHKEVETAKLYEKILNRFKKDFPDFVGAKVIFAQGKSSSACSKIDTYLQTAIQIKEEVPNIFAGFDLVGREESSCPLLDLVPNLIDVNDVNYYFHAGETAWSGIDSEGNLVDSILLGSKRIGHAYALIKHPIFMKEVMDRDIGLEINVISNSVLSLVRDLRNHPLNAYIANGMPVVLSSDDPGAWEAEPLTDDFYVAFVGATSRHSDLRLLKTISENSLKYSALCSREKEAALMNFHVQWKRFIDDFDCSLYS